MARKHIEIRGARTHNLAGIDVNLPRDAVVVLTGPSGSGKTSLAFDTLYADAQRRFIECMSSSARLFLEQLDPPDVDDIRGTGPALAIEQARSTGHARSTVATATDIHDFLRIAFSRFGTPHAPSGAPLVAHTPDEAASVLIEEMTDQSIVILAPMKERGPRALDQLQRDGAVRYRTAGTIHRIEDLDVPEDAEIEAVVDRVRATHDKRARLVDALHLAYRWGQGRASARSDTASRWFSEQLEDPESGFRLPSLEPGLFSFNGAGACRTCGGTGRTRAFLPEHVVPDPSLSLAQGAIAPWGGAEHEMWPIIQAVLAQFGGAADVPWEKLPDATQTALLHGSEEPLCISFEGHDVRRAFEGTLHHLTRRYAETTSDRTRRALEPYSEERVCSACSGSRLGLTARSVWIDGKNISDVCRLVVKDARAWLTSLPLGPEARTIVGELAQRLGFLERVGLGYLGLDRPVPTLSGGEAQRIRLATQLGRRMTGVLYVLDEPSIGLHPSDVERLIETLRELKDEGNSVVVVEHDRAVIEAADHVVELGPGAGKLGGRLIESGPPATLSRGATARGLARLEPTVTDRRTIERWIRLTGARGHNLNGDALEIPREALTVVSGVSGSGKSTLVMDTLLPALQRRLERRPAAGCSFDALDGVEGLDKVIAVDQRPIGRSPRSNPATFSGIFGELRKVFASLPEAKVRGYGPGHFSFNVKGGRCEACEGDGSRRIEMHLLSDVFVECKVCQGRRYAPETLEVRYRGASISDVLQMTVDGALELFGRVPRLRRRLEALRQVSLGYLVLGQGAQTLSGGEAQRLKLAKELSRPSPEPAVFIFDEPTTGLHFEDVAQLIKVLHAIVDKGHTVVVVEHDLDVLGSADWVIELGPGPGTEGGRIIAAGTPEAIAATPGPTGPHLAKVLKSVTL